MGSKGWYLFRYMGWTYFIRFSSRGIKVVGMHGHKIVTGKVHGRITWFKSSLGNWAFKFGKIAIKFYSWGNGWIRINGKKIKLTVSTNSGLPASQGYVWFRWGKITYYLRFYRHRFYVYPFGPGCKRVFNKVRGFCGNVNINKVVKKKCSARCNRRGAPVCDNLGHTHGNGCVFNYHKCLNPKLKIAHRGRCKKNKWSKWKIDHHMVEKTDRMVVL